MNRWRRGDLLTCRIETSDCVVESVDMETGLIDGSFLRPEFELQSTLIVHYDDASRAARFVQPAARLKNQPQFISNAPDPFYGVSYSGQRLCQAEFLPGSKNSGVKLARIVAPVSRR